MCPIVHWFDSCCHFTALTYWTWFSLLPLVFPLVPEENLSAKWNRDSRLILVAPFQTICHTSQFFTVLEVWCLVTTLHDWLFYYFVCVFSPFFSLFFMCTCDFTSPVTCMDILILYLILINGSYQRLMGALLSGLMWLLLQLRCTVLSRSKINTFLRAGCTFCPPTIIVKTVKGTQYTSRNQWPVSSLFHSYWMNAWMFILIYV